MPAILRILFLAAEADPLVKIGGLGDVAGSLPQALRRLSSDELTADVRLAIPFHGAIQRQAYALRSLASFALPSRGGPLPAEALELELEGLPVYLIGGPFILPDSPVYSSDPLADGLKFTFFSLASLELARQLDWPPHVLHANDWHTAPAVYALSRMRSQDGFFSKTATVLGLHNLPYLGAGAAEALATFDLPPAQGSGLPSWAVDLPLPLGLLTADHIVAASPSYAQEILTPEYGCGLEQFLRQRAGSLSGILNGIDLERWNPQTDPYLAVNFDIATLQRRSKNKLVLQREFNLEVSPTIPLLAVVSRLDYQKGVDLLPEALDLLERQDGWFSNQWQIIILGTGDPGLEAALRSLEVDFPGRARVALRFDAALSHRLYAGADMLLLPSRYEPCGLTQMIAMRYGCVPVARATGGLKDTIWDYNQLRDSTGFLFQEATSQDLQEALQRALQVYSRRRLWRSLQRRCMAQDFSWGRLAGQYLDLYQALTRTTLNH